LAWSALTWSTLTWSAKPWSALAWSAATRSTTGLLLFEASLPRLTLFLRISIGVSANDQSEGDNYT
jgi:hypothetical protein